ncbi:MAG: hypothetical protein RL141_547 [Candidatus Parcubacteria bacterium]|jgi:8-oxo-dGTP pyrophosphatase MutT (NUDIX family)
MSDRHKLTPAVFIFLEREGRVLFFRRLHGWYEGLFDVPAGHLEAGETFQDAACRELREETGISVFSTDLELVHLLEYPDRGYLYVFFRVTRWVGDPRIMEPAKHADLTWSAPGMQLQIAPSTLVAWERVQAGTMLSTWNEHPL